MIYIRPKALIVLGVVLALFGAGCKNPVVGPATGEQAKTDAVKAAEEIQFMAGDTFEIRQTVMGFGAFLPDLLKSLDGVRLVTIRRFAPMYLAELDWDLTTTRETESSRKLRAQYEALLVRDPKRAASSLPPTVATERVSTSGKLLGINLRTSHTAYLPSYWEEGTQDIVGEKTAIWLSDDAFLELVRTRRTVLNLGVFDEAINTAVKNVSELKDAYAKLRSDASQEGKVKDLTQLEADAEFIEWDLDVNGKTKKVSAIRARNWFGEVIVLNSRQNPMILKVTLNPIAAGAVEAVSGTGSLFDKLLGYEVKNIVMKRP